MRFRLKKRLSLARRKNLENELNKGSPLIVDRPEEAVVRRAAEGDLDARRELFERYREAAFAVAMRVTGRHEDAMDVVQDSFIKAFDRLADFRGAGAGEDGQPASFKTWFLRIVGNRALDLLRSRRVRLAAPLAGEDESGPQVASRTTQAAPGASLEQRELAERIGAALESLPPEQRAVFALAATGDMTYAEIAESLGIPIGTVMSRLYHARRKLAEQLKDYAPESVRGVQE